MSNEKELAEFIWSRLTDVIDISEDGQTELITNIEASIKEFNERDEEMDRNIEPEENE